MPPKEQTSHKTRRQREIEAIKVDILQTARRLAVQNGWPEVSIRKIAELIEYTPPVIYEHFKNKEAILMEIEAQGFRQLGYTLEEVAEQQKDPKARLLALTEATWEWAFKHFEVYQVMFNLEGIQAGPAGSQGLSQAGKTVLQSLQAIHLFESHIEELFLTWWALVHGYISMIMSQQLRGDRHQHKAYLLEAVARFAKQL